MRQAVGALVQSAAEFGKGLALYLGQARRLQPLLPGKTRRQQLPGAASCDFRLELKCLHDVGVHTSSGQMLSSSFVATIGVAANRAGGWLKPSIWPVGHRAGRGCACRGVSLAG